MSESNWRYLLKTIEGNLPVPAPYCSFSNQAVEAMRPYIPYCLRAVDDSRHNFIWLNRDYKPLGISSQAIDFADYGLFRNLHVRADEAVAAIGDFWLFNDGCRPWQSKKHAERMKGILSALLNPELDMAKDFRVDRSVIHNVIP